MNRYTDSTAHDLYSRLGKTIISGSMTYDYKSCGELKKVFGFPPAWQNKQKHEYNRRQNGFAMLTGERHNMTAIDIDDPSLPCAIELMDLMTSCNLVARTNKGFHYVFKYTNKLHQTTGAKDILIDIRNDGGCIFVEPTFAKTKEGLVFADYEWKKTPFDDEELEEIPEEVIAYLWKLDSRYRDGMTKKEKVTKKQVINEEVAEVQEESVASEASEPRNEGEGVLAKVVEALPMKYIDNYDDWIKIGMVLYNEGYDCSVWVELSKRSKKFQEGECEKHFKTFARDKGRKVMGATLWKLLKESNPSAFWSLMEFRQDFWAILSLVNHKDIAKFFYNINPDAYLWEESLGWYSLNKNNIWKQSDKSQPSGLKRHIADTLQDLAMDTKRAELANYQKASSTITDQDKQKELLKTHSQKIKQIHDAYKTFGTSDFCNGVISFLPSFYEKEDLPATMDMNRDIFAFIDGCYDLKTCAFRMITPQDYISTTTGYPYPKKADGKVREAINKFLMSMFDNQEDVKYLTQVLSSCLFGGNRWEEFYSFTGSGGNGKGVVADLLKTAFGDYYLSVDNTLFTKPLERKDQPIPALVEARGKRIMMTTEPESDDRLQGGLIKKISGGDIIEARTLHSKHIVKYVPQFKVILQMNNIPKMNKMDGGIERRMRIINFPHKFVSAEKMCEPHHRLGDPDIKEKYCRSAEWRDEFMLMLSEIYKTIRNLKALPPPQNVSETTELYMNENNPLKLWLNKFYNITKNVGDRIGATELKNSFLRDNKLEKYGDGTFKNMLGFNNISAVHTNTGNFYVGLQRKAEFRED
jgi:P4 family phage/plasmid primase-like protien